ncbi:MAG: hypothetical protein HY331_18820 [Chloroflexi bacterium]|nr:hypothetical protein [Chloroflexota bacterium]
MLKLLFFLTLAAALVILVVTRWQRIKLGLKVAAGLWLGLATVTLAQTGIDADQIQSVALIGIVGVGVYSVGRLVEHLVEHRRRG